MIARIEIDSGKDILYSEKMIDASLILSFSKKNGIPIEKYEMKYYKVENGDLITSSEIDEIKKIFFEMKRNDGFDFKKTEEKIIEWILDQENIQEIIKAISINNKLKKEIGKIKFISQNNELLYVKNKVEEKNDYEYILNRKSRIVEIIKGSFFKQGKKYNIVYRNRIEDEFFFEKILNDKNIKLFSLFV